MDIYEGPFLISKNVGHAAYKIKNEKGKVRGEINKRLLKPYKEEEPRESKVEGMKTKAKGGT
jgi:hypothetical protein